MTGATTAASPACVWLTLVRRRLQVYRAAVLSERIDLALVRKLAFDGVPDQPGLRARYWKLLFNYLPLNRAQEQSSLARMRALYRSFVDELIVNPQQKAAEDDHPLATSEKSTWNAYFKDSDLDFEIVKDAKRTFPQLHFFNHDPMNGDTTHYEALRRLLFVYAKLNPGIRYVQGMNELLAPIYYLFANAVGAHDRAENQAPTRDDAEADAFFCFTTLMSEVMNNFCKTLDSSEVGVHADMRRLNALLREKDAELWANLEQKGLSPQFYSFRWLTLLLSQEFELPDVMRLWDSLFADARRFEYLQFFCCAMLSAVRDQLFLNDFASNLKLLQKYPPIDPFLIHRRARELQAADYVAPPRPVAPSDSVLDDDDGAATGTGIVVIDAPSVVASAPVAAAAPAPPPAAASAAPPDSSPSPVRLLKNWFRRAASGTQ